MSRMMKIGGNVDMGATMILPEVEVTDEFFSRPARIKSLPMALLNKARIGIFGAGAIGTTMIPLLVNSGCMHLVFVDMDRLERSNFAKTGMVYNLDEDCGQPKAVMAAKRAQAAMYAGGEAYGVDMNIYDLGVDFIRQLDYVVSCVDDIDVRKYLNDLCREAGVPFFETGTDGLLAQTQCYDHTEGCYSCNGPERAYRVSCAVRYREDVEDGNVPSCQLASTMSATLCVYNLLKAICGNREVYNKQHYFDGNNGKFFEFKMPKNDICEHCSTDDAMGLLGTQSHEMDGDVMHMTRAEFQEKIDALLPGENKLFWPGVFVKYDYCPVCGEKKRVYAPARRVKKESLYCKGCLGGEERYQSRNLEAEIYDVLDEPMEEDVKAMTLFDLGYSVGGPIYVLNDQVNYHAFYLKDDMKLVLPERFIRPAAHEKAGEGNAELS